MKKFCLLIIALLLACTLFAGVAIASNTVPTVVALQPLDDVYFDTVQPLVTYKTDKYTVIVDKVDENYHILTYTDTLISDVNVGSSPINTACVYGDCAILCTADDGSILVYDLINKINIPVTGLPSNVYSISLTGSKLYVQTSTISVYDVLDLSTGVVTLLDTYDTSDVFMIGYGIFAHDDTVYYTKQSSNLSTIYKYDTQSNGSTNICEIQNLLDFVVVGNKIYALTSDSNKLYYYDTQTKINGSINLKHTAPAFMSVYSNELILTYSNCRTIDLYDTTSIPSYKTSLCSDSQLVGRFNTPVDVYSFNDSYAVADYGNDRVQVFSSSGDVSCISVVEPKSVALSEITVVATNSTIYVHDNGVSTYTTADGIDFNGLVDLTIDTNGTIYAIDTQNSRVVYKTNDDSQFKSFINTAPIAIAVAPHGSVVYCVYSESIYAYDSSARLIFSTSSIPALSNASVAVDATGTTFILNDTTLYTYKRNLTGYTLISTDTLNLPQGGVGEITVSSNGDVLLVDGIRHQVLEIKNTKALSYTPSQNDDNVYQKITLDEAVKLVYVEDDTFIYDDVDNYETTRVVNADTTLVLLNNLPVGDFYYVYYNGPSYIPVSKVTQVTTTTNEYNALALHSNTPLYKYPILNDDFKLLTVGKEATFKVIANVNDYNSNGTYWSQILYNNEIYYITRNNIGLAPIERAEDFGWAKLHSSVVGQKIKVYSLADDKSGVIGEYRDGTEVKLLSEIDSASTFTQVKIGDEIGYVKTIELTTGGFTTAQIVITLLILLGGTASVTILIISRKMHQRR